MFAGTELDQPRLLLLDDEQVPVPQQSECLAARVLVLEPRALPSVLVGHVCASAATGASSAGANTNTCPGCSWRTNTRPVASAVTASHCEPSSGLDAGSRTSAPRSTGSGGVSEPAGPRYSPNVLSPTASSWPACTVSRQWLRPELGQRQAPAVGYLKLVGHAPFSPDRREHAVKPGKATRLASSRRVSRWVRRRSPGTWSGRVRPPRARRDLGWARRGASTSNEDQDRLNLASSRKTLLFPMFGADGPLRGRPGRRARRRRAPEALQRHHVEGALVGGGQHHGAAQPSWWARASSRR